MRKCALIGRAASLSPKQFIKHRGTDGRSSATLDIFFQ
jgi:hypothetical protein